MYPHRLTVFLFLLLVTPITFAQKRPAGGPIAVVVDERLAALRVAPQLDGKLVRRISRGRLVAVRGSKKTSDGLVFLFVNVTSRTHGWIQREAVALPSNRRDEERLLSLIQSASEFERVARAKLFLDYFPRSIRRAEVLLLLGDAAESVAGKLARDASRRVESVGPERSYYLNHSGLDRYNRLGVLFVFDSTTKRLHYNGAAWREILRRFPQSVEAVEARKRLQTAETQRRREE